MRHIRFGEREEEEEEDAIEYSIFLNYDNYPLLCMSTESISEETLSNEYDHRLVIVIPSTDV